MAAPPVMYVNGTRHVLGPGLGDVTLLAYLRDKGLTGTKLGCGEGGCGACTCLVATWDPGTDAPKNRAINACLAPLYSCEGAHVVTVEAIGGGCRPLHPIQSRLAAAHGAQCGFCTPGFVMSLYALLRDRHPTLPTTEEIDDAVSGNLCRCTGYRPILQAFRSFSADHAPVADQAAAHARHSSPSIDGATTGTLIASGDPGPGAVCPTTGLPCACGAPPPTPMGQPPPCPDCHGAAHTGGDGAKNATNATNADPIFPPELAARGRALAAAWRAAAAAPLSPVPIPMLPPCVTWTGDDSRGVPTWHRPSSLLALLAMRSSKPAAVIVAGNTEAGVERRFKHSRPTDLISPSCVPELHALGRLSQHWGGLGGAASPFTPGMALAGGGGKSREDGSGSWVGGWVLGAAVDLTALRTFCRAECAAAAAAGVSHATRPLAAIAAQLLWFAGAQIRNAASLGGNVATASPISDLNPLWVAFGATVHLASITSSSSRDDDVARRALPAAEFFRHGYRQTAILPGEVLLGITLPPSGPWDFCASFKASRRRDDDIAIVTAGCWVRLQSPRQWAAAAAAAGITSVDSSSNGDASGVDSSHGDGWTVGEARFAFGGMAPSTRLAPRAALALVGAPAACGMAWGAASAAVALDLPLADTVPGGMAAFRAALAAAAVTKFRVAVARGLAMATGGAWPVTDSDSAALSSTTPAESPLLSLLSPFSPVPLPPFDATAWVNTRDASAGEERVTTLRPPASRLGVHADGGGGPATFYNGETTVVTSDARDPPTAPAVPTGQGQPWERGIGADMGDPFPPLPPTPLPPTPHAHAPTPPPPPYPVGIPATHAAATLHVTGAAVYADDAPLAVGTLHGAFVLSTRPHARLVAIDYAPAEAMPGVVGVVSARDVRGGNDIGAIMHDEEVFATETVRCVGAVIALVLADSHAAAKDAARAVVITYADLPSVLNIDDALAVGSVYDGAGHGLSTGGDVDAALAASEILLSGEAAIGGQEHFYLEPNVTIATPGEGGEMRLLSSTQAPAKHQKLVAHVLGVPCSKVQCRVTRLGGGFGGKETRSAFVACAAAVAAAATGRPVRLCLDRDDDMATTGQRHPFVARWRAGATRDGRLTAGDVALFSNAGCSLDLSGSVMDRALLHASGCYRWPAFRAKGTVCRTNLPSNTAFRGFGGPQGLFVAESMLDAISQATNLRPEVVREINLYRPEGDATPCGQPLENCAVGACWASLMATAGMEARAADAARYNGAHAWRKRALAAVPTMFGISFTAKFLNQAGALVHIYADGAVLVTHGGVEMGQGLHTKMVAVAAAALGVDVSRVHISETNTDKVPNASPTAASASSDLYGGAVLDACRQLAARLAPTRERLGPAAPWGDVAAAAHLARVDLSAHGFYATPDIGYDWAAGAGRPFAYYTCGAACAEVELDVLTGDHQVLRVDVVMDVGAPLNPALDVGQVEGGFVQGLGLFTLEECVWGDAAHPWVPRGMLYTRGPGTYKIPAAGDAPADFRVRLLAGAGNPHAIYSSKAVGEPPLFLAASVFFALKRAVAAARADAGLPLRFALDSPATCERLRLACSGDVRAALSL